MSVVREDIAICKCTGEQLERGEWCDQDHCGNRRPCVKCGTPTLPPDVGAESRDGVRCRKCTREMVRSAEAGKPLTFGRAYPPEGCA
jgi:hypothetical protein